jgi:hypothetical protein
MPQDDIIHPTSDVAVSRPRRPAALPDANLAEIKNAPPT